MARSDNKNLRDARATQAVQGAGRGGLGAVLAQHVAVSGDSLLRLLRDPLASLLTWTVIGIALALPLCLLLLVQNLQNIGSGLERSGGITLFMQYELTPEQLEEARAVLAARADVAAVELVTAEAALREFESASGLGDVLSGLDQNPLPASFLVTPANATAGAVERLRQELRAMTGVDSAQLDLAWIQRLDALLQLATRATALLAAMLVVGVVLVIGNTVRLAIENRRAEIVVVKLVGGTDAYVARPFLYTGFWYGAGGGLVALLLVTVALLLLQGPVSNLVRSYASEFALRGLGFGAGLLVLFGAALLGWLGAWISVLRHLRAIEPR